MNQPQQKILDKLQQHSCNQTGEVPATHRRDHAPQRHHQRLSLDRGNDPIGQVRPAHDQVGKKGVALFVAQRRAVDAAAPQALGLRHRHRRGRVPLVLPAAVDVGVGLAAEHGTPVSAQELAPVYLRISQAERERIIREGVAAIEAETGFTADLPAKTLLEVVNLSEYPQPLVSTFDEEFLQVPEEIIVDESVRSIYLGKDFRM